MLRTITRLAGIGALLTSILFTQGRLPAQDTRPAPPSQPLTLKQAVDYAARNYPAMRVSSAEVSVAEQGIALAKTAYLPRADVRLGVNRATRNNVFGLIFPNGVIPGISGPVQDESSITSTFGSSAGILFSWEAFDFGLRGANVEVAEGLRARAQASQAVSAYEVSVAVSSTYLNAIAGQQAVAAAEANVERAEVFAHSVAVLVSNELRPGADESRAKAELARARSEQIRAEEQAQGALATLAEWMGLAGETVEVVSGPLLDEPPMLLSADASLDGHPLAAAHEADIAVAEARKLSIDKEWRPKFQVQSAIYGRGTGARLDGTFLGSAHGLAPSEGNWAVGFNMNFDLVGYKRTRVRSRIEAGKVEREQAERDRVLQELKGEVARATIGVAAARKIAQNTPIELEAARTLEIQAQARYKAGLGTVTEVAEAHRLLRQAEVDNALAKLGIWRALFALAAARGEMDELLIAGSR